MANRIILRKGTTAGATPSAGTLQPGELAINTADGALFVKLEDNSVYTLIPANGAAIVNQTISASKVTSGTFGSGAYSGMTSLSVTNAVTAGSIVTPTTVLNGNSYSWPAGAGTSGQVLTTDGEGHILWATTASLAALSGTPGRIAKFQSSSLISDSIMTESGTNITVAGDLTARAVNFDTVTPASDAVGRLTWNDSDGTLNLGLKGGVSVLQIGQEQVQRVTNNTGAALNNGTVVFVSGAQGNRITVSKAQANSEAASMTVIGVMTEAVDDTKQGFCTTNGLVRDIDTSAFPEGAVLWLSATTPGAITATRPVAPNHGVMVGYCVKQNPTSGIIYVHVQNGYELDELHDVLITSPVAGNFLRYNGTAWSNVSDVDLATGSAFKINGTSVLSATTLGSGVTSSSLTSLGTLSSLAVSGTTTLHGIAYTWPAADGSSGQVLTTNGTGGLSWSTITSGQSQLSALTDVTITTATTGDLLRYNGTKWVNVASPDLASGATYKINGTTVLSGSALGTGVTSSSLTSVGTLSALTVSGQINSTNATDSSSTSTGAIITSGGLGVALKAYFGSTVVINQASGNGYMLQTTGNTTGTALVGLQGSVSGNPWSIGINLTANLNAPVNTAVLFGLRVAPSYSANGKTGVTAYGMKVEDVAMTGTGAVNYAIYTGLGKVYFGDSTDSSSTSTGSVVLLGGIGVAKSLYVGTSVVINGSTALHAGNIGSTVQGWDADLDAIAALSGTSGLLKKTAADTWTLDTSAYLTSNQSITISGDVSGSGTTAITATLATVNSNTGSFGAASTVPVITVNGKGLITAVSTATVVAAAGTLTGTTLNSTVVTSSLTAVGTVTTGTWSASFGAVSGANLTNLTAGNLTGTISSTVLGNSTLYVGTTAVTLNRASANQALTGISSITLPGASSGTVQIIPTAAVGTGTVLTIPATTGTVVTTGDTATVTNTMLAGSIANNKLTNSSVTVNGVTIALGASGTVTADASTLTGTSLNATVVSSSLTSVGTLTSLTMGGTLNLVTGTATVAPLKFTAGTNLTAAVAGVMEWNGTNLFITQTTGPTRKTIAYTDSNITGSAATLTTARTIGMTGDVSWTSTAFDGSANVTGTATLATVNSNVGTFNNVTVNGKGLVTAASNVSYLTANQTVTLSGDISGSGTTAITTTLATVNSNVGSFGGASSVPSITVNGKGLITAVSTAAVVAPAGTLSGTTLNATVTASSLTSVGTLTSLAVSGATTFNTVAYTWPATSGSSGQVLTTNGSGTLSWTTVASQQGGTSVTIAPTAPSSPSAGNLWWDSTYGALRIYYNDTDSSQWVDVGQGPVGPRGADGYVGADGQAATISVGSTTTGTAGTNATVTNVGTSSAAILNFVIPRGADGSAASVAVGSTTTGSAGTSASVSNSGTSSAAVLNFTIPRGDTGSAATVAVGTTTTGAAGSNAAVTNGGTSSAAVLNFTIPRGDTGATGSAATIALGTVTTGAAGSSASITNSGTSSAATFNFTIPRGDTGNAATIAVGTTTTGNAGTNASVTNSGTSSAATFDFTIPRGNTGATGPMGPKSTLLQYPTTADTKIVMFYTTSALTLSKMVAVLPGGANTPSVSYNVRWGSDVSATGTAVTTSAQTVTNISTGTAVTSFNSGSISAGSFVWVEVTAVSGTVPALSVTLEF